MKWNGNELSSEWNQNRNSFSELKIGGEVESIHAEIIRQASATNG